MSVESRHSRIRLRILSCGRMSENASRTEVPEARVPVVECLDGLARDYLKWTCTNSFCEKWHPPVCLFYKSENGFRFGEKCFFCTARLKNSQAKGPKRMVTKVQWLCWRSMSSIIERGDLLFTLTHQIHNNWVAYSRIWSRRSLHRFYGRAQTYGNRSDV